MIRTKRLFLCTLLLLACCISCTETATTERTQTPYTETEPDTDPHHGPVHTTSDSASAALSASPQSNIKKDTLPPKKKKPAVKNDTLYHYNKNKKPSVKISPWKDGERMIWLYDERSRVTYTFNDEHRGYSRTTELTFQENGAVKVATTHFNPGASRHWYETYTTFSPSNEPLTQVQQQFPIEYIDMTENHTLYWDKEKGDWVKEKRSTF